MLEQDIVEKAEGAPPWLSPLIAVPKKSGDVRLVLDMRIPNQALKRRCVQMPTVDDILQRIQQATVFTEVDLSQRYLEIPFAPESQHIIAFPTLDDEPNRFKKLIMGTCPSGKYFHEEIYTQHYHHIIPTAFVVNHISNDTKGKSNTKDYKLFILTTAHTV